MSQRPVLRCVPLRRFAIIVACDGAVGDGLEQEQFGLLRDKHLCPLFFSSFTPLFATEAQPQPCVQSVPSALGVFDWGRDLSTGHHTALPLSSH